MVLFWKKAEREEKAPALGNIRGPRRSSGGEMERTPVPNPQGSSEV